MSSDEPATGPVPARPSVRARLLRRLPATQFRAGAVVILVIAALVVAVLVSLLGSGGSVRTVDGAELSGLAEPAPGSAPNGSPVPAEGGGESPGAGSMSSGAGELYIHVLGAVGVPGLYRLPDGSRAFDAIAAAGGLLPEADPAAVNLARFVSDGEQLLVPVLGAEPSGAAADGASGGAAGGSQLVNLNTASAAELTSLPRIGEALAARIVAWREANGRFTTVDDLSAIEGIGAKTLDGLRAVATV